jgi:hypothetical protein
MDRGLFAFALFPQNEAQDKLATTPLIRPCSPAPQEFFSQTSTVSVLTGSLEQLNKQHLNVNISEST